MTNELNLILNRISFQIIGKKVLALVAMTAGGRVYVCN